VLCPITTSRRSLPFISSSILSTLCLILHLIYPLSRVGSTNNTLFWLATSSRMVVLYLITTSRRSLPFVWSSVSSTLHLVLRLIYPLSGSPLHPPFVSTLFSPASCSRMVVFYLITTSRRILPFISSFVSSALCHLSNPPLLSSTLVSSTVCLLYLSSPLPFILSTFHLVHPFSRLPFLSSRLPFISSVPIDNGCSL
jgi:hypothetical protein